MLKRKLRSFRGETLAEVLVAILVCGFSITLLVGMITTSMSINSQAREMDDSFFKALSRAETYTFADDDPGCQVVFSGVDPSVSISAKSFTENGLTIYGEVAP